MDTAKAILGQCLKAISHMMVLLMRLVFCVMKAIVFGLTKHFTDRVRSVFYIKKVSICTASGKKIVRYEPQPTEVWIIFYVVLLIIFVVFVMWNLGVTLGVS
ncbi:hypothetical protein [Caudoviricetes sp.]|nr:hypothetical protein [Caudoviricetes sp.]